MCVCVCVCVCACVHEFLHIYIHFYIRTRMLIRHRKLYNIILMFFFINICKNDVDVRDSKLCSNCTIIDYTT